MKKSSAWIMLVPGLVILLVCLAIPFCGYWRQVFSQKVTPFSFADFFKDGYYLKIFLRTVKIAVITTAFCMAGGIPRHILSAAAPKSKWRSLLAASIFPMMTNSVISSFAWINILGKQWDHQQVPSGIWFGG